MGVPLTPIPPTLLYHPWIVLCRSIESFSDSLVCGMAIVWLGVVSEEGGVNGGGGNVGSISPLSVAFLSLCWIKTNLKNSGGREPAGPPSNGASRQPRQRWGQATAVAGRNNESMMPPCAFNLLVLMAESFIQNNQGISVVVKRPQMMTKVNDCCGVMPSECTPKRSLYNSMNEHPVEYKCVCVCSGFRFQG